MRIAVYGLSGNPSTTEHLRIGQHFLSALSVDQVWYLVCPQNRLKSSTDMAAFEDRLEMARLNLKEHSGLVVKDLEARYRLEAPEGIVSTSHTLRCLTRDYPQHRFVLTMGADSFENLHSWLDSSYIAEHFPIVWMPRTGHTEQALNSPSARDIPAIKRLTGILPRSGWYALEYEANDVNATALRHALQQGKTPTHGIRPEVARYALTRGVYVPH